MEQGNHNTKKGKWKQLSEAERYKIEALLEAGHSKAEIAKQLHRSVRSIQREVKRGLVEQRRRNPSNNKYAPEYITENVYRADYAQMLCEERASHKGRCLKIGHDQELADCIEDALTKRHWSPDVIIGRIKAEGMQFKTMICVKTVYNYVYSGVFRTASAKNLLYQGKEGGGGKGARRRTVALNNRNGKSIDERPEAVNRREEAGHWEIDLIIGCKGSKKVILTLIDRKTRQSLYRLAEDKSQESVLKALEEAAKHGKGDYKAAFKSITADNGSEFLNGAGMKEIAGIEEIYYAHPFSSWERGSNENGNRMVRRFLPKGTDFDKLTQRQVQRIENWVNNYPRRMFGYKTANEMARELMVA